MLQFDTTLRFAVLPLAGDRAQSSEFARTISPHPLVHQELPHGPEYTIYNRRLTAMTMTNGSVDQAYWKLRRQAILRHTGELPIEIRGKDALVLLNRVFTRDVAKTRVGRCSYQIACYDHGGLILDGVLVRLEEDRFWYGQADGDLTDWLTAHARGMDVRISDPEVWISQVQGPNALDVLAAAVDGPAPEPFRYFDAAWVSIAGERVLVTRSGFTNELGWEVYLGPEIDAHAVGERILEAGRPFGLEPVAVGGARRIEAGLLNAGSDFDHTVTPFAAGLGAMVDFEKGQFVGRAALVEADRRCRTWGLVVPEGVARIGRTVSQDGAACGRVCSSAWSPFQRSGVAILRLDEADRGPGAVLEVACRDGEMRSGTITELPMYDRERLIPRGKLVDIPPLPADEQVA
ncbi:MAG: aminomethyltransferase family protein [Paracoccaceae bacterium]